MNNYGATSRYHCGILSLTLLDIEFATGYTISLTPTRDEEQCKSANYTLTDKVSMYYLCVVGSHACAQL